MGENKICSNARICILIFMFFINKGYSTTYYSCNGTDISKLNSWWTNDNCSGLHPSDFTTSGDTFILQAGHTWCTVGGNMTIGEGVTFLVNEDLYLGKRTLTVNGTLIPDANITITAHSNGTIAGSGTIQVTRVNASDWCNYESQYPVGISSSDLTIEFCGTGQQYLNSNFDGYSPDLYINNDVVVTGNSWPKLGTLIVASGKTFDLQSYYMNPNVGIINNGTIAGTQTTDAVYVDYATADFTIAGNGTYNCGLKLNTSHNYTITGTNTFSLIYISNYGTLYIESDNTVTTFDASFGNIVLSCGTTQTVNDFTFGTSWYSPTMSGPTIEGQWACIANANQVINYGTIGASSDYIAFSGTISNNGAIGANIEQLSTEEASCAGLPVELVSFEAESSDGDIILTWITASETNNDYFTLYNSTDGIDFNVIHEEAGSGNSSVSNEYEYVYEDAASGLNYFWLSQTDYDGTTTYSDIIALDHYDDGLDFHISQYDDYVEITVTSNSLEVSNNIKIVNISGVVLYSASLEGQDEITIELNLSPGIYLISGINAFNSDYVAFYVK